MIDLTLLLETAAELFDVSPDAVVGRRRSPARLVECRQAVAYVLHNREYTVREIGDLLGSRDHTTICYMTKRARAKLQTDPTFAARVRILAALFDRPSAPEMPAARRPETRRASWLIAPDVHVAAFFWGISAPPTA